MIESPDRDLILRARRGETEAFGELVRQTQAAVFNVCYRLLGERREAEDLAQETFIRAWERLHTFDAERPFLPWIRRVAANLCLNHLAARPPDSPELDEERDEADSAFGPAPLVEQRQQSEKIRAALSCLPPRYRVAIELRHFQELSYDEIARTLNLSLSDVKSDLFRARKLLAEKLKDNPDSKVS
jgi:RNA polymerase sigma-70 factor, ECF subfamily